MPDIPPQIKIYEKRFGNIAIEKGFITSDQLVKALNLQVQEEVDNGSRRLIGQILLELNLISAEQIKEILADLFEKENE